MGIKGATLSNFVLGEVDMLMHMQVRLRDVPRLVKHCRTQGPLFQSSLTDKEFVLLSDMMKRLDALADTAAKVSTCRVEEACRRCSGR